MKDTLNKIQAEITEAYSLLAMIPVRDTDVERMSEARARLRSAFKAAKEQAAELEEKEPNTPGGRKENSHG